MFSLERLYCGDQQAWNEFVECYADLIHTVVPKICFAYILNRITREEMEDIIQDIFCKLKNDFHLLKSYDPTQSSLKTWLAIIARSSTIDILRKNKTRE